MEYQETLYQGARYLNRPRPRYRGDTFVGPGPHYKNRFVGPQGSYFPNVLVGGPKSDRRENVKPDISDVIKKLFKKKGKK